MAKYDCAHCGRSFGHVNICLRHVRRAHRGLPLTYTMRLLCPVDNAASGVASGPSTPSLAAGGDATGGVADATTVDEVEEAGRWAASYAASLGNSSISARVTQFYEMFNDVARSTPLYATSGAQPSPFTTPSLRQALFHATPSTRTGNPREACQDLWRLLTSSPGEGRTPPASAAAVVTAFFKSSTAFSDAVNHERERSAHLAGWRETTLESPSGADPLGYRSGPRFIIDDLEQSPVKHLLSWCVPGVPAELVGPFRGAIFDSY